jgi:outer membrane lipoprotein carrier protein
MKNLLFALLAVISTNLIAQNPDQDPKAKVILDELSKKTKEYKTISVEFVTTIKGRDINETRKGKAMVKGDKFYYESADQKVFCDGKSVWNYTSDENECYIEKLSNIDDELNPTKMLTIWESGFKYQFVKESTENGRVIQEIKLFPKDAQKNKYHTIVLKIDKVKKEVQKVIIKGKDGLDMTFEIKKFETNKEIPDSTFIFEKTKFPGVVIIDNR